MTDSPVFETDPVQGPTEKTEWSDIRAALLEGHNDDEVTRALAALSKTKFQRMADKKFKIIGRTLHLTQILPGWRMVLLHHSITLRKDDEELPQLLEKGVACLMLALVAHVGGGNVTLVGSLSSRLQRPFKEDLDVVTFAWKQRVCISKAETEGEGGGSS